MGSVGGVGNSGPSSVNFVCLGKKEFYIDEPEVEEFDEQLSTKVMRSGEWRVKLKS